MVEDTEKFQAPQNRVGERVVRIEEQIKSIRDILTQQNDKVNRHQGRFDTFIEGYNIKMDVIAHRMNTFMILLVILAFISGVIAVIKVTEFLK